LPGIAARTLDGSVEICKLRFSRWRRCPIRWTKRCRISSSRNEKPLFFYGLFLRGHTADELRRDIAVPAAVLAKWDRESEREPTLRPVLEMIVRYRRHVLAIFENLIGHDSSTQKLQ
jgi:hypothetical protein